MAQMLIRHKVKDFSSWKRNFDMSLPIRKFSGEERYQIFQNVEDPNEVTVLIDWKSLEKAIQYAESTDLKTAMKIAGVIDEPSIFLTSEALEQ